MAKKADTNKDVEKKETNKNKEENKVVEKAEKKPMPANKKTKPKSTTNKVENSNENKTTKPKKDSEKKTKETDKEQNKSETKKVNKEPKETAIKEKEPAEIEEAVAKELKANKKIPKEELNKINTRVFQNIFLAIIIMFYLNFIILGFVNIENSVFITDLKVFSIAILAISIGIFEYAYKKDSGRHTIHGIEILVLAFVTMALIYVDLMYEGKFIYIVAFITYVFAIYYVAKSIIIYNRMKKEYFVNAMKEIIKK